MTESKLKRLDPRPAREDLTDREFTKILGGLLGSLSQMGKLEDLRNAVRWWAETEDCWALLAHQKLAIQEVIRNAAKIDGGGN